MTGSVFHNPTTAAIADFLNGIGLEVRAGDIPDKVFLPGVKVEYGALVVDESRLEYPGDILHEAGHLAVASPERRKKFYVDVGRVAAEEIMAIAWSYAASVHMGIDPAVVFHEGGYHGGGRSLAENFTQGHYMGVPALQWLGLTAEGARATELGVPPYPHMVKWMLDE